MRKTLGTVIVLFCLVGVAWQLATHSAISSDRAEQVQAASTIVPTVTPADPAREAVCREMLADINRTNNAWKSYHRDGQDVIVEVRDSYYAADFDAKRAFDANIRCAVSGGRIKDQGILVVSYIDARTHKDVAQWGQYTGFTVAHD
jgi:hypothetical protein